ncbi:hypothetical protein ACIA8G_23940 [Lentzea sp. NPDC051213]|uniref:hypothetical protein n=1 Tax=Lentzea sp. NPDC051213 TaxID=3364126 RepID=UPI00379B198A
MRKVAAVVLGCLLLTGCAASWQGEEVRYKIVSLDHSSPTEMFKVELVGDAPKGALDPKALTPRFKTTSEVSGGAAVGDEIVCTARQEKGSAFENSNVRTFLTDCRKA